MCPKYYNEIWMLIFSGNDDYSNKDVQFVLAFGVWGLGFGVYRVDWKDGCRLFVVKGRPYMLENVGSKTEINGPR